MTRRNRPLDPDGSLPRARDLEGRAKGLSGSAYVVGELDTSRLGADGVLVPGLERVAIRVRTPGRCGHVETVCAGCAESWMYDWVFYFGRTAGGRRLRGELGEEVLAAMAVRRAAWESRLRRNTRDGTAGQAPPAGTGEPRVTGHGIRPRDAAGCRAGTCTGQGPA